MNDTADTRAALACVPSALAPEERKAHFALVRRLFGELVRERVELPDGYAYRFLSDDLEAVARFAANERKCCPFLNFELALAGGADALWLRLTGPKGTHAVLDAELALSGPVSE